MQDAYTPEDCRGISLGKVHSILGKINSELHSNLKSFILSPLPLEHKSSVMLMDYIINETLEVCASAAVGQTQLLLSSESAKQITELQRKNFRLGEIIAANTRKQDVKDFD